MATLRPAAFQARAEKDIVQAAQVLEVPSRRDQSGGYPA
jgi:hypothetical protein